MKRKLGKKGLIGALSAVILLPLAAPAAFVFDYSGTDNQAFVGTLGDNFGVNSPVEVTQLGVFSPSLAGSGGSVPIAIYAHDPSSSSTSGWTQVAGTLNTITTSDLTIGNITYVNIMPVVLGPGLYSVVTITSSDYNSGNPVAGPSQVSFNPLGSVLYNPLYDIWQYGGSLTSSLPEQQLTGYGTGYPWPLPVFGAGTLSLTPVPEASTLIAGALLLLPFGASTLRILRRNNLNRI